MVLKGGHHQRSSSSDLATPVRHDIVGHPVNLDAINNTDSSSHSSDFEGLD